MFSNINNENIGERDLTEAGVEMKLPCQVVDGAQKQKRSMMKNRFYVILCLY